MNKEFIILLDIEAALDTYLSEPAEAENAFRDFLEEFMIPTLERTSPKNMIAVWGDSSNYRESLYPRYKEIKKEKKTRPEISAERDSLYIWVKRFLAYLGIKNVWVEGVESGDVIAYFCERLEGKKLVLTPNTDLVQLSSEQTIISLFEPWETETCPANLEPLYKSIVGDIHEGYIGVRDLGHESFERLKEEYGEDSLYQLDNCVKTDDFSDLQAAVNSVQDKTLQTLWDRRGEWSLSYKLAKLHPELCYCSSSGKITKLSWVVRLPLFSKISEILSYTGCEDLEPAFTKWTSKTTLITADNVDLLHEVKQEMAESDIIAYDFESYDELKHPAYQEVANGAYVDVLSQKLVGSSFCYGDNLQKVIYLPVNHRETKNLPESNIFWGLTWTNQSQYLVVHNAMFEATVAKLTDETLTKPLYDTSIMATYLDEEGRNNLKILSKRYLNYDQITYKEIMGDRGDMRDLSGEEVLQYGCDDSLVTSHLFSLFKVMMQLEGTWQFYKEHDRDWINLLSDNFIQGDHVDLQRLDSLAKEDQQELNSSIEEVKTALTLHCSTPSKERAQILYEEWWEIRSRKLEEKNVSRETMEKERIKVWKEALSATGYIPYDERVSSTFKPTIRQLNGVINNLNHRLTDLTKLTACGISDWLEENDHLREMEHEDTTKFLDLLGQASNHFSAKDRQGEIYEEFRDLCLRYSTKKVKDPIGDELNFGSPKQTQALLYGKLGLTIRMHSKAAKGSFRAEKGLSGAASASLKAIDAALVYDATDLSDWRKDFLLKLKNILHIRQRFSLYYKPYPLWISPKDGNIHPQIRMSGTTSHRPTGNSPNIYQLPKKDGGRMRSIFTVPEDYVYVSLDYNGQELRFIASESEDPELLSAYLGEKRKDPHSLTAAGVAGIYLLRGDVSPIENADIRTNIQGTSIPYDIFAQYLNDPKTHSYFSRIRDIAKAINFTVTFVGSEYSLARLLILPIDEAKQLLSAAFNTYRRIRPWQNEIVEYAKTYGYVQNAYGVKRHAGQEIFSPDDSVRARKERQLVNFMSQGCGADMLKKVLSEMSRKNVHKNYKLRGIKAVYDEITAAVPISAVADYIDQQKEIMEQTPPGHKVPMEVEISVGLENWGYKKELGRVTGKEVYQFIQENKHEDSDYNSSNSNGLVAADSSR